MHRLGASLFNEIRKYLSFREIHAKRVINSKWNHIQEVQKTFGLNEDPPGRACFKNITEFVLLHEQQVSATIIDRILSESRRSLETLGIGNWPEDLDFIPVLPNVKELAILWTPHTMAESFLRKCPGLTTLWHRVGPSRPLEVDLFHHKAMKNICICGFSGVGIEDHISIKNLSTHTEELKIFFENLNVSNNYLSQLLSSNGNISVYLTTDSAVDANTVFSVTKEKICVGYNENPDKLKGWLTSVKEIRDLPVIISEHLDVQKTFSVAKAIAETKLFSREEIQKML